MRREAQWLLFIVLTLTGIGIVAVFSASTVSAGTARGLDMYHYVARQGGFAAIGLLGLVFATKFNYHWLRSPLVYRPLVLFALAGLVAVLVPGIGVERNGAMRWISLGGMTYQPSEFAKMVLIVLLAVKLCENQQYISRFWRGFVPPLVVTVVFAGLVAAERDFGVPVIMCVVGLTMVFIAGARWSHLIISAIPLGFAGVALIVTDPERIERLMIFQDPWKDPQGAGYNLIQSMAAFARGGWFGQGAGAGEQKLFYLPAAHTDFIFAVWGEEMGLVGAVALVLLYLVLFYVGFRVASNAADLFGSLLATGIVMLFTIQATINMAVATGLAPTKGLTLPFISAGGTSLVVNMVLAGILLNVALFAAPPEPKKRLAAAAG